MLASRRPVVAVCATRTGAGKSQTTRRVAALLRDSGRSVAVLRHPMPYGDLRRQAVQRFARREDLDAAECTLEEREEYEPHLAAGNLVFAGIDYAAILRRAEQEADVIVWDGGNNDTPFVRPTLLIVVVDPLRPGHELRYHPGETNLRLADVCVVNKVDTAPPESVDAVVRSIRAHNPAALIVLAASPIEVEENGVRIEGRRVLAVEDGPTLTHGEMGYGAAVLAARRHGAAALVDPRPFAVGSIAEALDRWPHVREALPAMGYGVAQIEDLRQTIARSDADVVLVGTPIDLRRIVALDKPALRVTYRLEEVGEPTLADVLARFGLLESRAVA
jgi:predicted GTPase